MDSRNIYRLRACTTAMIATLMLLASTSALADPPMRVARLAYIDGAVSFSPAGEDEWVLAQVNRPFSTGDRIWSDTGSRVELQIGDASVRLGASTSASILNLDDRVAQVQLAQGVLNLRVREAYGGQAYEVDTPNLAFTVRQSGEYRIEVDPDGKATTVTCFNGEAEVYGESASYIIGARQSYRFTGTDLRDYESLALAAPDEFDRWASERDRRTERSVSARYVAPELVGYSDLDDYGTWSTVADYGPVWFPTRLDAGWVPYRDGHWAWIDPWGWTWVDNEPWGFAPFHYGRWAFVRERWCWVPGPRTVRPVYAPALVAFVGGSNFSLSIASGPAAGVAWFPLGPGEVYRPAYQVSRNYFTNVNVTNTRVSVTTVTNVYNNPSTNIIYRNRELARAVTAVPAAAFAGGHQVAQSAVPISREIVARAPVTDVAAVAPTRASLAPGNGARRGREAGRPPANALTRQVVAKNAPPPVASFSSRESQLAARPGKPIEPAPAAAAKAAPAASGANVKVLAPSAPANAPTRAENPRGASTQSIPRTNATAAPPGKAGEAAGGPSPQPNVPQPPERGKALAQEAQRDAPPQANVPRPPETPKGPAQPALRTPPPQASVPRPAESPRGPLQEATRRPAPQASVPRSPEAARVAPPEPRAPVQANVVRAPERAIREEPPRAAQPEAQTRQPEAPSERSMRPPPHQANVARPPEAPRAAAQQRPPSPPPQAQVRPQEPSRAPPPQVVRAAPPQPSAPRAPEPPKPPPQAAAHAPPPQANLARAPEPQRTAAAYREEGKGAEEKKQEPKR